MPCEALKRCAVGLVALASSVAAAQSDSGAGIEFLDDPDEAFALAQVTGKPVALVFGAVWCAACRNFKARTLPAPTVQAMGSEFHWVYIEIDRNLSLSRDFGVRATPHFIVSAPDRSVLGEALGALRPAEFVAFLDDARRTSPLAAGDARPPVRVESAERTPLTWSPDGYRGHAICFSHVGYGPLNLPSQAPGQILRLGLKPRTPSTLAKGQYSVRWTESVANIFAFEKDDFRLDYLTLNTTLSVAYGVSDTVLIEVELSDVTRTNSSLDSIVDGFHSAFGLDDSGRDDFPKGDNIIDLELKNGVEIEDTRSGSEAHSIALAVQHNLTCGTEKWPAVAYALDVRYHGNGGNADLEGDFPFSFGGSVAMSRRFKEDFYVYLGLGYVWHGLDQARGLPLADEQWSSLLALEWRYAPDRAWVIQYLLSEGVAVDRAPFDKSSNEIDIGWKCELSEGTVLELGLIENVIEVDNSPDFGFHFGIEFRF